MFSFENAGRSLGQIVRVVLLLAAGSASFAEEISTDDLLAAAAASNERVVTFSCTARDYVRTDDDEFPWTKDLAKNKAASAIDGLALSSECQVLCDRPNARLRCEGRNYTIPKEDEPDWTDFLGAYDGSLFRRYLLSNNFGEQIPYHGQLGGRHALHTLLGDGIGGHSFEGGDLLDWLRRRDGQWKREEPDPDGNPRLSRLYRTKAQAVDMRLVVTLAAKFGHLPKRIESYWMDTGTLCEAYDVSEFWRIPGEKFWVPVRGVTQAYYREAVFPDGVTLEQYQRMTPAEKKAIDRRVGWTARHLGPRRTLVIDKETLKLNLPVTVQDFSITFPPSAKVYDEAGKKVPLGGERPRN